MIKEKNILTVEVTSTIGSQLGVSWDKFSPEQFRKGVETELNGVMYTPEFKTADLKKTGEIVMANLFLSPGYYDGLLNNKPKKITSLLNVQKRYAIDASLDSIVDSPFTETYQSDFKLNLREDTKLPLDD